MVSFQGNRLRALLLDLDDTLLDNRTGLREAWGAVAETLVASCPEFDPGAVRAQIGRTTAWFWSDPARVRWGRIDLPRARRDILTHVLEALGRPDPTLAARAAALYTELRERSLAPLPGAFDALARLRRLVPRRGLLTNGAAGPQRAKVERYELERYFDLILIEGEFGAGKPEPRVFEHALAVLGSAPDESLMAGDDYEADVLGALRAGLHAVWVEPGGDGKPPLPPPRPHATVRSVVELVELVER